ncbi:MAG: chromosomal replication initiation protein DnaA [Candidatus Epulonipiscioides saccharophilum]|nr:MAG: chromosomal replication initiation protein DnaA [Epulopiscium sp. AS2M-Bin001]
MDQKKNWEIVLETIEKQISSVSYNTWFRASEIADIIGNRLIVQVKDALTESILSTRYSNLLKSTVVKIFENQYSIEFVIKNTDEKVISANKSKIIVPDPLNLPSNLNPKYTFDSFVVGNSNRMAHAAAYAVSNMPSKSHNPLFLYGDVGLGKTHLMQSIAHFALHQHQRIKVLYTSTEKFTNELINSIRDGTSTAFRNKYRNIDILLIDDIQFIAGKERTQEEFFHTFNTLYESNKQIIISSDRYPNKIEFLEARLRSRFECGLIADIQPPDLETRIAILKKKADTEGINIDSNVLEYIAENINSNIRELEGTLNRIIAYSSCSNEYITLKLAQDALKNVATINKDPIPKITPLYIQKIVSEHYNITTSDLLSSKRNRNISIPRQIAMFLCRKLTDLSLQKIAEHFGGRNHTTILHGYEKIIKNLNSDKELAQTINLLELKITPD